MNLLRALLLLTCLLTGCSTIVGTPEVRLQRIAATGIDTAGIDLEVNLLVANPNRFNLTLLGYSYALSLAETPLSSGGQRQQTIFPGKQETLVRIPARVRHGDLLELLKHSPNPDHIPYHLQAGLQVDTPLGEVSVPVDSRGEFAIPEKYRPSGLLQRFKGLFNSR